MKKIYVKIIKENDVRKEIDYLKYLYYTLIFDSKLEKYYCKSENLKL